MPTYPELGNPPEVPSLPATPFFYRPCAPAVAASYGDSRTRTYPSSEIRFPQFFNSRKSLPHIRRWDSLRGCYAGKTGAVAAMSSPALGDAPEDRSIRTGWPVLRSPSPHASAL